MSSSLLTNNAAMTALLSLNMTQQTLATYEKQVSTGLKISSAADNASYWSIATSMSSQTSALGAVSNALSESGSMLSTMSAALTQSISIMDNIQNDLVTAQQPGTDLTKVQTDIQTQQQMLLSIGSSATFNGQNMLSTSGGTVNLVSSYEFHQRYQLYLGRYDKHGFVRAGFELFLGRGRWRSRQGWRFLRRGVDPQPQRHCRGRHHR